MTDYECAAAMFCCSDSFATSYDIVCVRQIVFDMLGFTPDLLDKYLIRSKTDAMFSWFLTLAYSHPALIPEPQAMPKCLATAFTSAQRNIAIIEHVAATARVDWAAPGRSLIMKLARGNCGYKRGPLPAGHVLDCVIAQEGCDVRSCPNRSFELRTLCSNMYALRRMRALLYLVAQIHALGIRRKLNLKQSLLTIANVHIHLLRKLAIAHVSIDAGLFCYLVHYAEPTAAADKSIQYHRCKALEVCHVRHHALMSNIDMAATTRRLVCDIAPMRVIAETLVANGRAAELVTAMYYGRCDVTMSDVFRAIKLQMSDASFRRTRASRRHNRRWDEKEVLSVIRFVAEAPRDVVQHHLGLPQVHILALMHSTVISELQPMGLIRINARAHDKMNVIGFALTSPRFARGCPGYVNTLRRLAKPGVNLSNVDGLKHNALQVLEANVELRTVDEVAEAYVVLVQAGAKACVSSIRVNKGTTMMQRIRRKTNVRSRLLRYVASRGDADMAHQMKIAIARKPHADVREMILANREMRRALGMSHRPY